ncbi:MAG: hypothetical protein J6J03_03190, partial [Tyzzerella sp.]|nr:hypothetical protein [Tyzzerella sp.]
MLFNLFKKKNEEPKPLVRTITEINYLADTENTDIIYKLIKDDLEENPEYSNSAKELREYYDHEKVWKYYPYELAFKIEGKEVFAEVNNTWYRVGRLKRNADLNGNHVLCFYANEYKYVTEDSIEKE